MGWTWRDWLIALFEVVGDIQPRPFQCLNKKFMYSINPELKLKSKKSILMKT